MQEKPKLKKAVDLFDDEDGEDIFNEKYSPQPTQSKKEVVEEKKKSSEKKVESKQSSFQFPNKMMTGRIWVCFNSYFFSDNCL